MGLCLVFPVLLIGQKKAAPNAELLTVLKENIAQGNLIAFRDLAKMHDKYPDNQVVISLIKQHTLFTQSEWDWNLTEENSLLTDFFYEKEALFKFSELLEVFYLTPIEARTSKVEIEPINPIKINPFLIRKSVQKIGDYLKKNEVALLRQEIEHIGLLNNPTVFAILNNLLDKKALLTLKKEDQQIVIKDILDFLPDSIAFEKLLTLTKKEVLPLAYCQKQLARLSNNFFNATSHTKLLVAYWQLQANFDNNLNIIKEYGFQKTNLTNQLFFEEKVDYYGWLLATTNDSLYWVRRNAMVDMLATKQPKALFYIAGLNFKFWKKYGQTIPALDKLLQQRIDVKIKIDKTVIENKQLTTAAEQEQLLHYWSIHYDDFEWDDFEQKFVNQQLFSDELEAYDRYFRRLNSTNDTIAYKAFIALCTGKPNEISQLIKKFKPLLRNYNTSLPPLKYKILEQISLLTHFCKQQNIVYLPSPEIEKKLTILAFDMTPNERLAVENDLIDQLTIFDLTALEYYAAINAQNLALNYSIGRILDYVYTKHWEEIISNERYFRLFLLKVHLFNDFGGFGVIKKYANKITLTNTKTLSILHNLQNLETNQFIKESIAYFLDREVDNSADKKIAKFLEAPVEIGQNELKELPAFNQELFGKIMAELFLQTDKKAAKNIGTYLQLHASVDLIPQLFETPKKQWTANKHAGKAIIKILEQIYQFSFETKQADAITKWWELWQTNPENYTEWSEYLFQKQLIHLNEGVSVTINDINKVSESIHYQEKNRALCLSSLQKVKRSRTIYRLKIKPKISASKELNYLKGIEFSSKMLGNLPKIFEIDDAAKLLQFIYDQAQAASIEQKSALFNTLFRQDWFIQHITTGTIDAKKCDAIKLIFSQYLSKSTFLTEYEEQNTQLNIVHLENAFLTLKEKLIRISKDSLNETIRYDYLNVTLSRMEFPEIMIAFSILKDFEITNKNLFFFLNRDFGLPIFEVPTEKAAQKILKRLKNHNEYEFYEQTLVDFGLPILKKTGDLDFQKIYELLTYDLVVPFLGEGGKYRDYYCYGLVKLLELHFKTTLDFHPKLNENQTFYTFNSYKRVEAWRTYLLAKKLVEVEEMQSFK
ncbi:MAG: hypothetical protein AB8G86_02670 [Saprospiraceae bacterium]